MILFSVLNTSYVSFSCRRLHAAAASKAEREVEALQQVIEKKLQEATVCLVSLLISDASTQFVRAARLYQMYNYGLFRPRAVGF